MKIPFAVPNWQEAYKWLSVQLSFIGATIALVWQMLPEAQKDSVLQFIGLRPGTLAAIMFALVIVGRLKSQPGLTKPDFLSPDKSA